MRDGKSLQLSEWESDKIKMEFAYAYSCPCLGNRQEQKLELRQAAGRLVPTSVWSDCTCTGMAGGGRGRVGGGWADESAPRRKK